MDRIRISEIKALGRFKVDNFDAHWLDMLVASSCTSFTGVMGNYPDLQILVSRESVSVNAVVVLKQHKSYHHAGSVLTKHLAI